MTHVALELPDDIAQQLGRSEHELSRRALEALAAESYRRGEITVAQVGRMLGLASRWEADAFLKERQAFLHYNQADLEADVQAIRQATGR